MASADQAGAPAASGPSQADELSNIMESVHLPPTDGGQSLEPVWADRDLKAGVDEWIRPMLPSISMNERHQDIIEPFQPGFYPDGAQLDQLFTGEKLQLQTWGGLKSWESQLFGDIDAYVPEDVNTSADAEPWYQARAITVDESTWLDCFQRSRWMNFDKEIQGWRGKFWHMSDDDVWNQMRPVIEVSNRMLLTSIEGPWLGSCLNPSNFEFLANIFRHTGKQADVFRCNEAKLENRISREEGRRLLNAALCPRVVWSFHDREHAIADNAWAYCSLMEPGLTRAWISLGTYMLREIFDQTLLSDLSPLRRQTGKMTAIYKAASAVFGDEKIAEMGASYFENTFGSHPMSCIDLNGWVTMLTAAHVHSIYGTALHTMHDVNEPPTLPDEIHTETHPLPTVLSMIYATEDFWPHRVGKYGADALRFVPNMISKSILYIRPAVYYRWAGTAKPVDAPLRSTLPGPLEDALNRINTRLAEHRTMWKQWRSPWYDEAFARWQFTPYSIVQFRRQLPKLITHFRPRGREKDYSLWFWRGVGFLVIAALPRCDKAVDVNAPFVQLPNGWRTPATDPTIRTRETIMLGQVYERLKQSRRVQWEERARPYSVGFDRQVYLEQAVSMFRNYKEKCPVPIPRALEVAFEAQTWKLVAQAQSRSSDDFLDFDFEMPVYSEEGLEYGVWEANICAENIEREEGEAQVAAPGAAQLTPLPQIQAQMVRVDVDLGVKKRGRVAKKQRLRYFTWGEIGDHQHGRGTGWWILKANGEEYDVYDITNLVKELQIPDWMVTDRVAPWGAADAPPLRVLSEASEMAKVSESWEEAFRELRPIGRALQHTRPEEVALRNGLEGQPAWIMIGQNVYDITDLETEDTALRECLFRHAGGFPINLPNEAKYGVVEVARWLAPLRVRTLSTVAPLTSVVDSIFTKDEVAALSSIEMGLCTIFHGNHMRISIPEARPFLK
ncbi:hypothetical protein ACHAQA_006536 [Verticillium albo-atrum]